MAGARSVNLWPLMCVLAWHLFLEWFSRPQRKHGPLGTARVLFALVENDCYENNFAAGARQVESDCGGAGLGLARGQGRPGAFVLQRVHNFAASAAVRGSSVVFRSPGLVALLAAWGRAAVAACEQWCRDNLR